MPLAMASSEVPHVGRLIDSQGAPVSATVDLTFRLHSAADASSAYWTELHEDVVVDGGAYSVVLGSVASLQSVSLDGAYLGVSVGDHELLPRRTVATLRDGVARVVCEPGQVARMTVDGWGCGSQRTHAGKAEIAVSHSGALPSTWTQVNQRSYVAFDWDSFADQVSPGQALEARMCLSFTDSGTGSSTLGMRIVQVSPTQVLWEDSLDSTLSGSAQISSDCGAWVPVSELSACAVNASTDCRVEMMHEQNASTTLHRMWWEVSVN